MRCMSILGNRLPYQLFHIVEYICLITKDLDTSWSNRSIQPAASMFGDGPRDRHRWREEMHSRELKDTIRSARFSTRSLVSICSVLQPHAPNLHSRIPLRHTRRRTPIITAAGPFQHTASVWYSRPEQGRSHRRRTPSLTARVLRGCTHVTIKSASPFPFITSSSLPSCPSRSSRPMLSTGGSGFFESLAFCSAQARSRTRFLILASLLAP